MSNGQMPLISIIMPVYNTQDYVERSVHSILAQTYTNLELICIDDGSTDETGVILDKLANEDKRVIVIHKKNEGVTDARNVGLNTAKGDFIGFVDSDDYISETMYHELLEAIQNNNTDIATCSYYMDFSNEIKIAENQAEVPIISMDINKFLPYIYERDKYKGVAGYIWTRLFRKEILKTNEGKLKVKFEKKYLGADDIVFVAETNIHSKTIVYVNKPLYYYYQREGSIVHDLEKQYNTFYWITAYERVIELYKENDIEESVLEMLIRMYVYRCGKLLEIAKRKDDLEKKELLRNKVKNNLLCYVKTNMEHLDRVKWIVDLMVDEEV